MNHDRPSLEFLARLAEERSNLLAGPLSLYKKQEGLDDQQLAALLQCEPTALARLALCERPRPAPYFRQDVQRIATYIHADFMQLAMLIRAAESREALGRKPGSAPPTLLAARDHENVEAFRDDENE